MAKKVIGFEIKIEGTGTLVKDITKVQDAIKETRKELKATADDKEAARLGKQLTALQGNLKNLTKEQRVLQEQFAAGRFGADSVDALKAELKGLELQYNRLSKAQREAADGKALAKSIAGIREEVKGIGVGLGKKRLADIIGEGLKDQIPVLGNIQTQLQGIGGGLSSIGGLVKGGFAAFAIAGEVAGAVGEFAAFTDQLIETRRQIAVTFNATGAELDELTKKVQASTTTFATDIEETLTASNAIVQTFGTDASKSVDLLNTALLGVRDRGRFLGDVTGELEKLAGLGIDDESAIALVANAGNLDFNVDVIAEPLIKLREQSSATQEALVNAFGAEKTKAIFAEFEKAPLDAIKTVSAEFSKLDDRSKESGALLADVFGGAGEDDITTVKALQNITLNLDDLADAAGGAAERERQLLAANEELAAAQNEIAKRFEGTGEAIAIVGAKIQTFFLNVLTKIIDVFSPLFSALGRVGSAFAKLGESLGFAGDEGISFIDIIEVALIPLDFLLQAITFIVDVFAELIDVVANFIDNSPRLQSVIGGIGAAFEGISDAASAVGGFVSGVFEGIAAGAGAAIDAISSVAGAAEEAAIESNNFFSKLAEENEVEIANIRKKAALRRAAAAGFEEAKATIKQKEAESARIAAINEAAAKELAIKDKAAKKIQDAQDKANAESLKREQERLALINQLTIQLIDAQIANIQDAQTKEVAAEKARFAARTVAIESEIAKQAQLIEQQAAKVAEIFGAGSDELTQFNQQAALDLQAIRNRFADIQTQEAITLNSNLLAIEKSYLTQDLEEQKQALTEQATLIQGANSRELLILEEQLAQQLITQKQFDTLLLQAERDRIADEQQILDEQQAQLQAAANAGIDIKQSEFARILTARQQLATELAKLEEQGTKKVAAEAKKQSDARLKALENGLGFLEDTLGIIDQIQDASAENLAARQEKETEQQSARIEQLNEGLNAATGLERKFIEQQIKREEDAAAAIAEKQIREAKKVAAADKAIKIAQATANTALAITNILANVADPTLIGAFKIAQIAFATATGLASIGQIAAQPLATGGVVGQAANIPTQANGDNVLTTLTRGEVVLNKQQQAAAGGASFFRSIGVPGFASGGIIGAAITAPRTAVAAGTAGSNGGSMQQAIAATMQGVAAINNRIDRLQVIFSVDAFDDLRTEQNNISKNTKLE